MKLKEKLNILKENLRYKKIVLAFSGGADSTFLALVAQEVVDQPLLITFDNGVFPKHFITQAKEIATNIGLKHKIIKSDFLKDPIFCSNYSDRCYLCKNRMYKVLRQMAEKEGFEAVVDGTNITDLLEDRPGLVAGQEYDIMSPLVQARFTASEVKRILKDNNIKYNPSSTCLATRIPSENEITRAKIQRIDKAEKILANHIKADYLRVRDEDGFARIELYPINESHFNNIDRIETEVKLSGFKGINKIIGIEKKKIEEMIFYQPCKQYKGKIMFEKELPCRINIEETGKEMKSLGEVKKSIEMGIIMINRDDLNILIFEKGKIVARGINDKEEAQELLYELMPLIRRKI